MEQAVKDRLDYYYKIVERVARIENPYIKESAYKNLFLQGVLGVWDSDSESFFKERVDQDLTLSGV